MEVNLKYDYIYGISEGSYNDMSPCARASVILDNWKCELENCRQLKPRDATHPDFEDELEDYQTWKSEVLDHIAIYQAFIKGWFMCLEYNKNNLIKS